MGRNRPKKLRFAVVGLGHIAQAAVLPAFKHCKNAELTALVSGDPKKLNHLAKKYGVKRVYSYHQFDECVESGLIDAVYIALPNHLHREYTVRAAEKGIHVLCEKPMAVTSAECEEMIRVCDENEVRLMIGYRLHFEEANLEAIGLVNGKKRIGELKMFQSIHSMKVDPGNIRTVPVSEGGGPSYDLGIYDINAARYIFQDEPVSVSAESVGETLALVLRFSGERLASLIYSFAAADTDTYRVVGTQGDLVLDPAYTYVGPKTLTITSQGRKTQRKLKASDHFAGEIDYFSRCVFEAAVPEPSGYEGLADVRIIEAIYESARERRVVDLRERRPVEKEKPSVVQKIKRPAVVREPEIFHAKSPSKKAA